MYQGSVGKCDIKRRGPKDSDDKTPFGNFSERVQKGSGWRWSYARRQCEGAIHFTLKEW